jgi:hypothetical protein
MSARPAHSTTGSEESSGRISPREHHGREHAEGGDEPEARSPGAPTPLDHGDEEQAPVDIGLQRSERVRQTRRSHLTWLLESAVPPLLGVRGVLL